MKNKIFREMTLCIICGAEFHTITDVSQEFLPPSVG